MKRQLGRQETLLFAYAQMRRRRLLRTGDLLEPLRLSRAQERELFRRLVRGGLIARVRPGLFLVPPRLPLGGAWSPNEAEALNALMADAQGRYQICGPNAFNFHGLDDQIPNRVYAYNNRISGTRRIGVLELTLIKVADERLGDTVLVEAGEGAQAVYASRGRTLVDAVYDWSRFNGIPRGYQWIREELRAARVTPAELVDCTLRYGAVSTIRRMGALLEIEGIESRWLRKLGRPLQPTTSSIPWIPTRPKRGPLNRRWGVVMNQQA